MKSVAEKKDPAAAIPDKLYFKIGEVAEIVGVKPYVLRYWETEFPEIAPSKSKSKQRLYKRKEVETILHIRDLLYKERFTIDGARKRLKELGKRSRSFDEAKQISLKLPASQVSPSVLSEIRAKLAELEKILDNP